MAKMTYTEQLRHPNWQRKRLEIMTAADFQCESCGDKESTLNVHHKRYIKGRLVWEYEAHDLQCLCQPCHEEHHDQRAVLDALLTGVNVSLATVIGLVAGFLDGGCLVDEENEDALSTARSIGGGHYDLGVLASIVGNEFGSGYARVVDAIGTTSFTPVQEASVADWRDFDSKLEKSGL